MSIATVVTRGYGSFGTIAFVATAGFSIEQITLLVTCFLNVKADKQNQMNILSAVAGAANILGTIQDNVNISVTLKTDVNIRGEVC